MGILAIERKDKQMRYTRGLPYMIISLALVGLLSMLFLNPLHLFKSVLSVFLFGALLLVIIRFLFRRNNQNANEMRKYRQALKQSQKRYQHNQRPNSNIRIRNNRVQRRRRPTHLRVIEGKKSKDKDRATF